MITNIDHLVIGAETLEAGVAYLREALGVDIPYGGEHLLMGTHNHLMQLGNDVFLEVIAVNPEASDPGRPRWYGLDDPYVAAQIARQPQLLTWVVNTADIAGLLRQTSLPLGVPERVTRGALSWYFGVMEDGRLPGAGLIPHVIQWHVETHPAGGMADLGCRLQRLTLYSAHAAWLAQQLAEIDAAQHVALGALAAGDLPYIEAHIETPDGLRVLSSRAAA